MERTRKFHNSSLSERAKELRKNPTKEEKRLWFDFLRTLPVHFSRQKIIGPYIVDFYCAKYALVIELDGSQHYEDNAEAYDEKRDAHLASLGFTVLRYSNLELNRNYKNVCTDILNHIGLE